MTKPLEPGSQGHAHSHGPKTKLTPEEFAAGKTPNSGKLHKDGSPVPGQSPEADAVRAAERAAEKAGEVEPPEVPDPPVV